MSDDERQMLLDLHDALLRAKAGERPLLDGLRDLHDALLEVPVGAGKEARPLLDRLNSVVVLHERASWALRATVYLVSAFGAIAGGVIAIRGLWR